MLEATKNVWQDRVTTVFARRGHYARDKKNLATYRRPDIILRRIGNLLDYNRTAFVTT
jgi:hypothetical protein